MDKKTGYTIKIVYVCLLFQMVFAKSGIKAVSILFNYFDELIAVMLLLSAGGRCIRKVTVKRNDLILMILFLLFLLLGAFSSIVYRVQPAAAAVSDAFTCGKFMVGYMGIRLLYRQKTGEDFIYRNLNSLSKGITAVFFSLTLHDMVLKPIFPKGEFRYFTESVQLCYPHTTYLAAAVVVLLCVLVDSLDRDKGNFKYLLMASWVLLMTLRVKAIAFLLVFWLLFFTVYHMKIRSETALLITAAAGCIYTGYRQFASYFLNAGFSPRALMFQDSLLLARESFPLGKGFAAFASNISVRSYSPLYERFGYQEIYGMSEQTASYLNDGFWQIILGQFGFLGVALMVLIICRLLKNTRLISNMGSIYIAALSLNIYLIISSIAETSYFNPFSFLYFMLLAFIANQAEARAACGIT